MGGVDVLRLLAPRWIAAGLGAFVLAIMLVLVPALRAGAASSSLDVGDQPVIVIRAPGGGNEVEIRTWDRPTVQIDGDGTPALERRTLPMGSAAQLNRQMPPAFINPRDPSSPSLPPEVFPLANIRPGPHEVIVVTADPGTHLTVTVPATTGVLDARIGAGRTTIDGFRGADLFAFQGGGQLRLQNVSTTAFLQMGNGLLAVSDSTFDRVRVRANNAHTLFERVHSKQIEASSIHGAIVYDGGTFDPGLARFDSVTGNIALGVSGPAQLSARSQDGHVYTLFDRRDAVVSESGNSATATVGGGGTVVSALSSRGNVLLYDGSLRSRKNVPEQFRTLHQALTRPRNAPVQQRPGAVRRFRR